MSLATVDAIATRQGPTLVSGLRLTFYCTEGDCDHSQEFDPNQITFRGEGYNGQPFVDLAAAFGMMDRSGWTVHREGSGEDERISMHCPDHA